jgi:2-keto-3-deoxy-galactonokinase
VLNVGSHWKAIRLDAQGRIHSSVTSLSGELVHATQTQTILASAVPHERPSTIDASWCEAGMKEERRSGLARALFCVRLLELNKIGGPEQRLSFLIGVYVGADRDAMLRQGVIDPGSTVIITGAGAAAEAWRNALEKVSVRASIVSETEIEAALLAGLGSVAQAVASRAPSL